VPDGTLLALLGPSGSGKTTLLRIIAGLEFPEEGVIVEDGEDITERHARQREVGFVFQHDALFRHMSVFENVAFGLRVRRTPPAEVKAREARVYLRPDELELSPVTVDGPSVAGNGRHVPSLPASVVRVTRSGAIIRVACRPHGSEAELHVDVPAETARRLQFGEAVHGLRYGSVLAVVQDGVVVQIERSEKPRLGK
jgi:hypothetical protein